MTKTTQSNLSVQHKAWTRGSREELLAGVETAEEKDGAESDRPKWASVQSRAMAERLAGLTLRLSLRSATVQTTDTTTY